MKRNLVGSFQNICVKLTYAMTEYLAMELQITLSGLIGGIDDASLIEIVMSRSNQELAEIRNFYQQGTNQLRLSIKLNYNSADL